MMLSEALERALDLLESGGGEGHRMVLADGVERALTLLTDAGREGEIRPESADHVLWLGIGACIGKGWAAYRGDGHFRITAKGMTVRKEREEEEERLLGELRRELDAMDAASPDHGANAPAER